MNVRFTNLKETAFEEQVRKLDLPDNFVAQAASTKLQDWCEKNRFERFVPEDLLNYWDITVYEEDINL